MRILRQIGLVLCGLVLAGPGGAQGFRASTPRVSGLGEGFSALEQIALIDGDRFLTLAADGTVRLHGPETVAVLIPAPLPPEALPAEASTPGPFIEAIAARPETDGTFVLWVSQKVLETGRRILHESFYGADGTPLSDPERPPRLLAAVPGPADPAEDPHARGRPLALALDGDALLWAWADAPAARSDRTKSLAQEASAAGGKVWRVPLKRPQDGTIAAPALDPAWLFARGLNEPRGLAQGPAGWFVTDVGPGNFNRSGPGFDELNHLKPEGNYGWPTVGARENRRGFESALLDSTSARGWLPAGAAFVSTGPWQGSVFFTGRHSGVLYRTVTDARNPRQILFFEELLANRYGPLTGIAARPDGSLVVLTADGRILHIQP